MARKEPLLGLFSDYAKVMDVLVCFSKQRYKFPGGGVLVGFFVARAIILVVGFGFPKTRRMILVLCTKFIYRVCRGVLRILVSNKIQQ